MTNENIAKTHTLIRSDHRLTIREMANVLNLTFYAIQLSLTQDMDMHRMSTKSTEELLSNEHKTHRLQVFLLELEINQILLPAF